MSTEGIETGVDALARPDEIIGQSQKTRVYGYSSPDIAIKVPKIDRGFVSEQSAAEEIRNYGEAVKITSELIEENGGRKNVVVPQEGVIHNSQSEGGVSYTRVQKRLHNSQPLAEVGLSIFKLPKQSLLDLRSIFISNIDLWKQRHAFLDLVGSTVSKRPKISKIAKHLLPLFFSENIVLDQNREPKLIDLGGLNPINSASITTKIRCYLQVLGSYISAGLISSTLLFK